MEEHNEKLHFEVESVTGYLYLGNKMCTVGESEAAEASKPEYDAHKSENSKIYFMEKLSSEN